MPKLPEKRQGWPELVDATMRLAIAAREANLRWQNKAAERIRASRAIRLGKMSSKVRLGSTVAYARAFLHGIRASATDPLWFARGRVVGLQRLGGGEIVLARVLWFETMDCNGPDCCPGKVNAANLAVVGPNLAFAGARPI